MKQRIVGTYHIGAYADYRSIVVEQLSHIVHSGILSVTDKVLVGISCAVTPELADHVRWVLGYSKASVYLFPGMHQWEFPTLKLLHEEAKRSGDFKAWYIHSKGVMSEAHKARRDMMAAVVGHHELCASILDTHDSCGLTWAPVGGSPPHYSGNFWWARSAYLRTLPDVDTLDHKYRMDAEFWIGYGKNHNPRELQFDGKRAW